MLIGYVLFALNNFFEGVRSKYQKTKINCLFDFFSLSNETCYNKYIDVFNYQIYSKLWSK